MFGVEPSLMDIAEEAGENALANLLHRSTVKTVDALQAEIEAKDPESNITRQDLQKLKKIVIQRFAAIGQTIDVELDDLLNKGSFCELRTGIRSLDELLLGSGYPTHTLAEISGLSGSGKTVSICSRTQADA